MNEILITNSFSYLSAKELLSISTVCKLWYSISSLDVIWLPLVEKLWKDKVYIPAFSKILLVEKSAKLAYFSSLLDSKRAFMTKEELTSIIWSYRFKKEAGEEWLDQCPWNYGKEASQSKFHSNYVLERLKYADNGDHDFHTPYQGFLLSWKLNMKLYSGYHQKNVNSLYSMLERCGFDIEGSDNEVLKLTTFPTDDNGKLVTNHDNTRSICSSTTTDDTDSSCSSVLNESDSTNTTSPTHHHSFTLPHEQLNPIGEQLVLFVNGMQVPVYHLSRSPTGNWGFLFQSCWAMYTSWKMPKKGECLLLEENLDITVENQWLEVKLYTERMQVLFQANGIQNVDDDDVDQEEH